MSDEFSMLTFPPVVTARPMVPSKVVDVVCGRGYVSPDRYDDLPAIIQWTAAIVTDPSCPARFHDDLKRMCREASDALRALEGE